MIIESLFPPIHFQSSIDDKHYLIVDGKWQDADRFYSREELDVIWKKKTWSPKDPIISNIPNKVYSVNGSKNAVYEVRLLNGQWSCTCAAFSFKRYTDCKHIKEIKNKIQ